MTRNISQSLSFCWTKKAPFVSSNKLLKMTAEGEPCASVSTYLTPILKPSLLFRNKNFFSKSAPLTVLMVFTFNYCSVALAYGY